MASLYHTTTNSSARDTKHTKQVSLNADVDVYDSSPKRPRQSQKKASSRLANPAYRNLSNHQHAAFEGFKLGLFGTASTADGPKAGASASKRAKDKVDDGKSSKTIIEKYYNLVKGPTNEDYEDTLTSQHM